MAQPIASAAVGRVNRRFLLLAFILAALSAVLVVAALSGSGDSGGSSSGADVPVVVAKAAIPAGTIITADMLGITDVSENAVSDQSLSSFDAVVGRTARYPIAANQQILVKDVVTGTESISNTVLRNVLEGGARGMAIKTDAVIGAGGLVLPGDRVDVLWLPGAGTGDSTQELRGAQLLAENVEVVAVQQTIVDVPPSAPGLESQPTPVASNRVPGTDAAQIPDAVTVTLMVSPEVAARIFCGEHHGILRLAVRAFGDESPSGLAPVDCVIREESN
jgi:Flp pilus assembly protein CpaB